MYKLGLIGNPLDHSASAEYFKEKFKAEGIEDFSYSLYPLKNLKDLTKLLKDPELIGLNVTIPYKKDVLPYLYEIDPLAVECWAVNTIRIEHFKGRPLLKGYNTDCTAFSESLLSFIGDSRPKALLLGSGGAAAAAKVALRKLDIDFTQVSRQVKMETALYEDLDSLMIRKHKLIINATPVGMFPKTEARPEIPYEGIGTDHYLFDMVYNPAETAFLKAGKEKGAHVKNGLDMLHLQAEKSWDIWLG